MNRTNLVNMIKDHPLPGVLCSSDGEGAVNAAVFGSARLIDEQTFVVALGDNRTLENLQKHQRAVYIFFEPGPNILSWKGGRLYLEVERIEDSGPIFDETVAYARDRAGKIAASMLKSAVVFKINEVRALIDLI